MRPSPNRFCPRLERLDGRDVPAVIAVTSLADSGPGTLRAAIDQANGTPLEGDTIVFTGAAAGGTVTLTTFDTGTDPGEAGPTALTITSTIIIKGTGERIFRDPADANAFRLFRVAPGGFLTLDTVRLGGGAAAGAVGDGGAVYSQGALEIASALFTDNTATGAAGVDGRGGAVFSTGTSLIVRNSTFAANAAVGGAGAAGLGGAVFIRNGTTRVVNSTSSLNTAAQGGRGVYVLADGETAMVDLSNTIVAQSDTTVTDVAAAAVNGGTLANTGTNNLIRTQGGAAAFPAIVFDPNLGSLGNNGGPTPTFALLSASPAVDAGSNDAVPQSVGTDQRGFAPRAVNGAVDIGAYEFGAAARPVFAVGAGQGGSALRAYNRNGSDRLNFGSYPFGEAATGGVTVATADVNADGVDDVIAGAGPGGDPLVVVYDGRTGAKLAQFFAFERAFRGGVYVAAADGRGPGLADVLIDTTVFGRIVVGAGAGGDPRVQVYQLTPGGTLQNNLGSGVTLVADFYAYAQGFRGGVTVAVTGDGQIVTGAGPGGLPHVKLFTVSAGAFDAPYRVAEQRSFYALRNADGSYFTGGVFVAAGGNLIAVGAMAGGAPRVQVVNGFDTVADFNAFDPAFRGGVRVGFGAGYLLAGAGPGGGPRVRAYDLGAAYPTGPDSATALDFFAFGGFPGGVFVG